MSAAPCRILMFTGSLRAASTNTAVLRTAQVVSPEGTEALLYDGLGTLPLFNPDDDTVPLDSAVADLRASITGSDALLFSTPEYAGALPGPFKNLLDWTVGGGETVREASGVDQRVWVHDRSGRRPSVIANGARVYGN